jgi:hypothetical protein
MALGLIKTLGLAGAALTAWYFLDPKKGAQRRESFAKGAKDLYDNAGEELSRLGKNATEEFSRFSKNAGEELSRLGKDIASGVTDTVSRAGEIVQEITGKSGSSSSATESASARSENHAAALNS